MDSAQQDGEDLSSEKPEGCIGEIRLTGFSFVDNIYIYIFFYLGICALCMLTFVGCEPTNFFRK